MIPNRKSQFGQSKELLNIPVLLILLILNTESTGQTQNITNENFDIDYMHSLYLDAIAESMYEEADVIAKQIIELSIKNNGLDSHVTAKALTSLAIAQHGIEDYESAILNYTTAIEVIERIEDRLNKNLISPLRGLGAAHLALDRPDLARETFDRAIHISHVNDGPHNLEQIEILQSLANIYMSVSQRKDVADIHRRIYYLQARNIDPESMDIIPALKTKASWEHQLKRYDNERRTLKKIINITEKQKGNDSLELIDPLLELGKSYLYLDFRSLAYEDPPSVRAGDIFYRKAIRIAEGNPEATWMVISNTKLAYGDYFIMSDRASRARRIYRDVWNYLSEDEFRLENRAENLEKTVVLYDISPPNMLRGDPNVAINNNPEGYKKATAVFEYTVSTRGLVKNITLNEINPPGFEDMQKTIARELTNFVYRPRLENGNPVDTKHLLYSHDFYYLEDDLLLPEDKNVQ